MATILIKSIEHPDVMIEADLTKQLGGGGSKTAFDVGQGYVLMLPNICTNREYEILLFRMFGLDTVGWNEIVDTEVYFCQKFKSIGLLTCNSQKVIVSSLENPEKQLYAYLSTNFNEFAKQDMYIIDHKNNESSTFNDFMFGPGHDLDDANIWKPVMRSFIVDCFKRCLYGWTGSGDSFNYAIMIDPITKKKCMRALNFDFTGATQKWETGVIYEHSMKRLLSAGIEQVLFCEAEYGTGEKKQIYFLNKEYEGIKERITEALLPYVEEIFESDFPELRYLTEKKQKLESDELANRIKASIEAELKKIHDKHAKFMTDMEERRRLCDLESQECLERSRKLLEQLERQEKERVQNQKMLQEKLDIEYWEACAKAKSESMINRIWTGFCSLFPFK